MHFLHVQHNNIIEANSFLWNSIIELSSVFSLIAIHWLHFLDLSRANWWCESVLRSVVSLVAAWPICSSA